MKNKLALIIFLLLVTAFWGKEAISQVVVGRSATDTSRNLFGLKEKQRLGIRSLSNSFKPLPENVKREVEYDAVNKRYIIRHLVGNKLLSAPQYLTIDEYQRLISSEIKRDNWRVLSNEEINDVRRTGVIPSLSVNSKAFERIFGGNTINIQPSLG